MKARNTNWGMGQRPGSPSLQQVVDLPFVPTQPNIYLYSQDSNQTLPAQQAKQKNTTIAL